jgi:hypothetical protein
VRLELGVEGWGAGNTTGFGELEEEQTTVAQLNKAQETIANSK